MLNKKVTIIFLLIYLDQTNLTTCCYCMENNIIHNIDAWDLYGLLEDNPIDLNQNQIPIVNNPEDNLINLNQNQIHEEPVRGILRNFIANNIHNHINRFNIRNNLLPLVGLNVHVINAGMGFM